MSTPFFIDPEFLHTCLMCPCRSFYVFFFSLEMWDPLRPKYPKKYKKRKNLAGKKNIRKRLGRGTLNTCAKFQGIIYKKGCGLWPLKEFGVICLNQLAYVHTRYTCRSSNERTYCTILRFFRIRRLPSFAFAGRLGFSGAEASCSTAIIL